MVDSYIVTSQTTGMAVDVRQALSLIMTDLLDYMTAETDPLTSYAWCYVVRFICQHPDFQHIAHHFPDTLDKLAEITRDLRGNGDIWHEIALQIIRDARENSPAEENGPDDHPSGTEAS